MHPPFCSWHVHPCKLGITCQWCFGADLVWSHTFVHCYSLGEWSPDAQVTDNGYSAWAWLGFRQNGPRARKGRDAEASSKRCWSCWCAPWAAAKCSLGGLYSFLGYINMEPCPLLCPKAGRLSCPFVWVDFAHGEWGLVAVLKNRSHRPQRWGDLQRLWSYYTHIAYYYVYIYIYVIYKKTYVQSLVLSCWFLYIVFGCLCTCTIGI